MNTRGLGSLDEPGAELCLGQADWPRRTMWLLAVVVTWLGWIGFATGRARGAVSDDALITARYAGNLASGAGLVFNPGERVFGCTEPLLAMLQALVRWGSGAAAEDAVVLVHAGGVFALATALLTAARRPEQFAAAAVFGTLVLTKPFLWSLQGFAWPWVGALLVVGAHLAPGRPTVAGVALALAVGFRPDALLGGGLLVLAEMVRLRRPPWRLLVAWVAGVATLAALAWWWFGTPLPTTLAAKQAYSVGVETAAARSGLGFWAAAAPRFAAELGGPWVWATALAAAYGLTLWRWSGRALALLIATGVALAVAYPLLGVAHWPWYTTLPMLAVLASVAVAATARGRSALLRLLAFAAILACLAPLGRWTGPLPAGPRVGLYRALGAEIARVVPLGRRIAALEVGALAVAADRPFEDLLGLVSPRRPLVGGGLEAELRAGRHDAVVVVHGGRLAGLTQQDWFRRHFRAMAAARVADLEAQVFVRRTARRRPGGGETSDGSPGGPAGAGAVAGAGPGELLAPAATNRNPSLESNGTERSADGSEHEFGW